MREKIQNIIDVEVEGVDLTSVDNLEFYIRQGGRFFLLTPKVLSSEYMEVILPYEDAMKLTSELPCRIQFCYTFNGVPQASEVQEVEVGTLLKKEGYNIGEA